ncbi:MAG: hypothetical protein PVI01_05715 [Gemmatimonadales bacterium]
MAVRRGGAVDDGTVAERRNRRRRVVMLVQGTYYILTGLWPLAHFSSFSRAVALSVNPFQAQASGAVLVVIGAYLLEAGRREPPGASATLLGIAIAGAIAVVDLVWLPRLAAPSALWGDLLAEVAIATALVIFYPRLQAERSSRPPPRRR